MTKNTYSSVDFSEELERKVEVANAVIVFANLVSRLQTAHYDNDFAATEHSPSTGFPESLRETLEIQEAKKYFKLWWCRDGKRISIHSFVNKENGEVLKAASCAAPAKHARGNVLDSDCGASAVYAKGGPYVRYL